MNKVAFFSADKRIGLNKKSTYKKLIQEVFVLEGIKLKRIAFIFCSDKYLLDINKRHLHHNFYTDVITFLISIITNPVESEVYISIERIKENAKTYNVSYQNELLRVMIHGALHVCGYNDKLKKSKKLMQKKEDFYIKLYEQNFPET